MPLKDVPPVPILEDIELGNVNSNDTQESPTADREQELDSSYAHVSANGNNDDDGTWSDCTGAWSDVDSEANLNVIRQQTTTSTSARSNNRRRNNRNRCCCRKQMRWVVVCLLTVIAVVLLILFAIWIGKAFFDRPRKKQKLQQDGTPKAEEEGVHLCVVM